MRIPPILPFLVVALIWLTASTLVFAQTSAPVPPEFIVNQTTLEDQADPDIAADSTGRVVVVWQSWGEDGDDFGVYARRFDSQGAPLDDALPVNTTTSGNQVTPRVACDAAGNFVTAWSAENGDGDGWGVAARRFDSFGDPIDAEFIVNVDVAGDQANPDVSMAPDGRFVIVWEDYSDTEPSVSIAGVLFDSSGDRVGDQFQVNTYDVGEQSAPAVSMDDSGAFAVVWQSDAQDFSHYGIFSQWYDASGLPDGPEMNMNMYTPYDQVWPAVAAFSDGARIIVWQDDQNLDPDDYGIVANVWSADREPFFNVEIPVNIYTTDMQRYPHSAALSPFGCLVVWQSTDQDGDDNGIFAQRFTDQLEPVGSEIPVNVFATGSQKFARAAWLAGGGFAIVWQSEQTSGIHDIIGRIFAHCDIDADCDDSAFCNGRETCDNGVCLSGAFTCDDGLFCTGEESCDEATDSCDSAGDPCVPDLVCNEDSGQCDPLGDDDDDDNDIDDDSDPADDDDDDDNIDSGANDNDDESACCGCG